MMLPECQIFVFRHTNKMVINTLILSYCSIILAVLFTMTFIVCRNTRACVFYDNLWLGKIALLTVL